MRCAARFSGSEKMAMPKFAIVAAMEHEVRRLVRGWPVNYRQHNGRQYKFFEETDAVLVCGGIGAQAATGAARAAVELYSPDVLISAGFAGSLMAEFHTGQALIASRVIDAASGKSYEADYGTAPGGRILLTVAEIA